MVSVSFDGMTTLTASYLEYQWMEHHAYNQPHDLPLAFFFAGSVIVFRIPLKFL